MTFIRFTLLGLLTLFFTSVWAQKPSVKGIAVTATLPKVQPMHRKLYTIGEVESLQAPIIASEVSAQVKKLKVKVGDSVKKGAVLAVLNDELYRLQRDEAKSEVARLNALLKMQKVQVKRLKTLLKRKGIDRASYDKAVAKQKSYQAQLSGAKARLAVAALRIKQTKITSPIAGEVAQRWIGEGDFVATGQKLFQVVDTNQLRARVSFSEVHALEVKPKQTVILHSPVDTRPITTQLDAVRPNIDLHTRSMDAFATFKNQHHWKVGSSVNATIITETHPKALTIPARAIVQRRQGSVVYVLQGYKVKASPIKIGLVEAGRAEILDGLYPYEKVVVDGAGFLSAGMTVHVTRELP